MDWRARWKASKETGTPLFPNPVCDWNPSQVELSYWFSFYDSIYEHPDRPPIKVINDDDLLDKWVKDKHEEVEKRAKKKSGQYDQTGRSAINHDEVITFDSIEEDYYYEIEDEYNEAEY